MSQRWKMLSVLFFARLVMAFQFQSVAALSPLIVDRYLLSLLDIGLLIGLYLGPGVIVAFAGGAIAARMGDRRVVGWSLALMLIGAVLVMAGSGWGWLVAGRVLAGIGGVVINVLMTKMVVDWFAGKEIGTAMAVFVTSWPVGISMALLVLPGVATLGGLATAWALVLGLVALALVLFLRIYHAPGTEGHAKNTAILARIPVVALVAAAALWALYNTAFAMVFGFGPLLLAERGLTAAAASSATSVFIIFAGIGIPLGGVLADRTGRRDAVILAGLVGAAILMPLAVFVPLGLVPVVFAVTGLIYGLSAGPSMALPSLVLAPAARVFGMGVFFSIYYAAMLVAPPLVGGIADRTGGAEAALWIGSAMLVVSVGALAVFRRVSAAPS